MQLVHKLLGALKALPHRPLGRFAAARNSQEFGADFAKIVGKNVVRTFAIVAMKDVDGQGGQAHVRVQASNSGIVPNLDFSEKDAGEYMAGELELAFHPGQFVDSDDTD